MIVLISIPKKHSLLYVFLAISQASELFTFLLASRSPLSHGRLLLPQSPHGAQEFILFVVFSQLHMSRAYNFAPAASPWLWDLLCLLKLGFRSHFPKTALCLKYCILTTNLLNSQPINRTLFYHLHKSLSNFEIYSGWKSVAASKLNFTRVW